MAHRLGFQRRQRLQPRPWPLLHRRGLKPFLEGDIPITVELYARMCGTDPAGYVAEGPGISVYALSEGTVYRTYVTAARGVEPVIAYYTLLDRTPKGRQESPTEPLWIRRHDEYEQPDGA
jgi:predicted dithiol-disulfide oxidoreductase (DUF899 family)